MVSLEGDILYCQISLCYNYRMKTIFKVKYKNWSLEVAQCPLSLAGVTFNPFKLNY